MDAWGYAVVLLATGEKLKQLQAEALVQWRAGVKTPVFNGEESYNSTDFGRLSTECVLDKEVETFLKVVFPKEDRDEVCLDTPVWMANHPLAAMQPLHYDEPPVTKSALKGKEFTCKSQPGTVVVFPFGGSIIVYPGSHKQQLDSRIIYPCRRVRVQPGCAIFMTIMGHRGDGLFSLNDSAGLPVPKEEYLYTTSTHHWVPRLHLYVARTRTPRDRDITILVPSDVAKQFAHRTDNIEDIATTTFLLEHNMLEQIFGESSMREYGAWVSNRACEIPWNAVFDLQTRTAHRSILGHEKSTNGLVEVGSGACGHKPSYRNIPHHARLQTQPTTSMNYFREVVDHHT